jgi:hypothetical protein
MLMSKRMKRTGSLMLLIAFVLMILLSTSFIFIHADHDHDHHGPEGACATCARISVAQHLLRNIASAILEWTAALHAVFIPAAIIDVFSFKVDVHTPVSLKVRLNN